MTTSTLVTKANNTFSLALFKKLSDKNETGNVFYSPFSISSALAMVMLGARGSTARQMSEVLGLTEEEQPKPAEEQPPLMQSAMQSQMQTRMQMRMQMQQHSRLPPYLLKCLKRQGDQDDVYAGFAKLLSEFNKADTPYSLSLANRLFGEASYQFVENFLEETKKYFNTELESVNFKTGAEEARVKINSWVERQTHDKIKDLLVKGVVNNMTKLLLVNAIYFKGNWNEKFKEDSTVDGQFRINKSL